MHTQYIISLTKQNNSANGNNIKDRLLRVAQSQSKQITRYKVGNQNKGEKKYKMA